MNGKSKQLLRMSAFLAALILEAAPACAQGVALPPDFFYRQALELGVSRDCQGSRARRNAGLLLQRHRSFSTGHDGCYRVGLFFPAFERDVRNSDAYSDLVPNDRILFDQQGRKLEYKFDPKGNTIYPSGRAPVAANSLHWERIPIGSPVEAVFKQICQ